MCVNMKHIRRLHSWLLHACEIKAAGTAGSPGFNLCFNILIIFYQAFIDVIKHFKPCIPDFAVKHTG